MDKPDFLIEISGIQRHFEDYNRTGRTEKCHKRNAEKNRVSEVECETSRRHEKLRGL